MAAGLGLLCHATCTTHMKTQADPCRHTAPWPPSVGGAPPAHADGTQRSRTLTVHHPCSLYPITHGTGAVEFGEIHTHENITQPCPAAQKCTSATHGGCWPAISQHPRPPHQPGEVQPPWPCSQRSKQGSASHSSGATRTPPQTSLQQPFMAVITLKLTTMLQQHCGTQQTEETPPAGPSRTGAWEQPPAQRGPGSAGLAHRHCLRDMLLHAHRGGGWAWRSNITNSSRR